MSNTDVGHVLGKERTDALEPAATPSSLACSRFCLENGDTSMKDRFCRSIDYLRISVTDRCNLRCVYCMPPEGVTTKAGDEILTYDEIGRIVRAAVDLGVRRVRLTGGEPLVRADLPDLVTAIARTSGIKEVSLTTNGLLLARHAKALAHAGLRRVNVSLDTLVEERFRRISRIGRGVSRVLAGIHAAQRYDLTPIKINTVVVRGYNDDELTDLARLALSEEWHVRFIELMPVGQCAIWDEARIVPAPEMKARLETELGPLLPATPPQGGGPARYFRLPGVRGTVGFITPVSHHFCNRCNRLRLTADGKLRPCLLSDREIDLRATLCAGATQDKLHALIGQAVAIKPDRHYLAENAVPSTRVMVQIGG
jgi:cyclic pyranopterin phosphate synthase